MSNKLRKILNISLNVVFAFLVILVLTFTVYAFSTQRNNGIPEFFGKSYLTVRTDSMNVESENFKGFKRGDIIVIQRYNWLEASQNVFEVGDIITFEWTLDGEQTFLTHRIIEVNEEDEYYITQGDVYKDVVNAETEKVYFVEVEGSYVSTVRGLGNILLFLEKPVGFLICIVIPILALFIFEIFNFRKVLIEYRADKKNKGKSTEELQKEIEELQKQLAKKEE